MKKTIMFLCILFCIPTFTSADTIEEINEDYTIRADGLSEDSKALLIAIYLLEDFYENGKTLYSYLQPDGPIILQATKELEIVHFATRNLADIALLLSIENDMHTVEQLEKLYNRVAGITMWLAVENANIVLRDLMVQTNNNELALEIRKIAQSPMLSLLVMCRNYHALFE